MHVKPTLLPKSTPVQRKVDSKDSSSDDDCDVPATKILPASPVLSTPSLIPGISQEELTLIYAASRARSGEYYERERYKHYQAVVGDQAIPSAAATTATVINAIPQGTLSNGNRLGQSIRGRHLTFKLRVDWENTSNSPSASVGITAELQLVRFVLYIDRMPGIGASIWAENINPTTGTNSLVTTGGATGTYGAPDNNTNALWNLNTHGTRYHILLDKVIRPKAISNLFNGAYVCASANAHYTFHMPVDWVTSFYNTGGTDLIENSLEFHIVHDIGNSTWQTPPRYSYSLDYTYSEVPSQ